jgi:hypothetical protein
MPQAAWMQVVEPSVYEDYESLRLIIGLKSPNLKMVTTQEEFDGLLRARTVVPSHFKIFMENKDGSVVSSNAFDFVHGNVKAHTKIEAEESNKRLSLKNKGVFVREAAPIVVLQSNFQTHDLKLVDITQVVESGSADAYVDSKTKDSFVGAQVTRSTANEKGFCKIGKGKEYLIDQIGDKGFLVFIMLKNPKPQIRSSCQDSNQKNCPSFCWYRNSKSSKSSLQGTVHCKVFQRIRIRLRCLPRCREAREDGPCDCLCHSESRSGNQRGWCSKPDGQWSSSNRRLSSSSTNFAPRWTGWCVSHLSFLA